MSNIVVMRPSDSVFEFVDELSVHHCMQSIPCRRYRRRQVERDQKIDSVTWLAALSSGTFEKIRWLPDNLVGQTTNQGSPTEIRRFDEKLSIFFHDIVETETNDHCDK